MVQARNYQIREREILERLRSGELTFPPLDSIEIVSCQPEVSTQGKPDALVDITWAGQRQQFAVELKAVWTPQAVTAAMSQATAWAAPPGTLPMVIVPFLSQEQLLRLQDNGVSGMDLCGNGVVTVPPKLLVFRSGQKNRFCDSRPIQNAYRRASSLVARMFLLRDGFDSVSDVLKEIQSRNGRIVMSTVSKALSRLQEDLVIGKEGRGIRLLQSDVLMSRLEKSYERPDVSRYERVKCAVSIEDLFERLNRAAAEQGIRLAVSGASSVGRYATLATEPVVSIYCSRLECLLTEAEPILDRSARFPNVELIETQDPTAYFDPRVQDGVPWAPPTQTWLELVSGDTRQQQAALQVRERILLDLAASAESSEV